MRLLRLLAVPLLLAGAVLMPGSAAANTAQPAAEGVTAAQPIEAKYFLGTGYGPYNIALEAAYATAYGAAAQEGYPAGNCSVSAGPAGMEIGNGYWQILLEIYCLPPAGPGSGQIINQHAGKCVDVKGAGTKEGTPVQLWDCNGTNAQVWRLHSDGTIRALGHCMDVQFAHTAHGTKIGINDCHGADNQRWEKLPNGQLRSVHSGRCLASPHWAVANGTQLEIWDCAIASNQQWYGSAMES